jgi:hypothetical protein
MKDAKQLPEPVYRGVTEIIDKWKAAHKAQEAFPHEDGWRDDIVKNSQGEIVRSSIVPGQYMTFGEAVRDEVETYLYSKSSVFCPADPNDADEPHKTIEEILLSLGLGAGC